MNDRWPVWSVTWRDENHRERERYFTGEEDDLVKWLDGLWLPFVVVKRRGTNT